MDQDQDTNTIFTLNDYGVLAFFFMLAVILHRAGAPVLLEMASLTSVVVAMEFIHRSKKQKLEGKTVAQLSLVGAAIFGLFSYVAMFKEPLSPFVITFCISAVTAVRDYMKAESNSLELSQS